MGAAPCAIGELTKCSRPATIEVYGLMFCEVHGEEIASGATEEVDYDLESEFLRPINSSARPLSPHIEAALRHGASLFPRFDSKRDEQLLFRAYPLDLTRMCSEARGRLENYEEGEPLPSDEFRHDRLILHRHMRLAFEEEAYWLVEMLEGERESVAAQTAYCLALERQVFDE